MVKRKLVFSKHICALTHETCRKRSRPLSLGQLRLEPQHGKTDSNYIDSHSDSMYSSRQIHRERSRHHTRRGSSFLCLCRLRDSLDCLAWTASSFTTLDIPYETYIQRFPRLYIQGLTLLQPRYYCLCYD